jgi:Peptidoglycan-binding protein, CsiV
VSEIGDEAGNGDSLNKPGNPSGPGAASLAPLPSLQTIEYRAMARDELGMRAIYERLQRLDAYRPVLWAGWSQTAVDESGTVPIRLRMLGVPPLDMDGTISLYVRNYLHLVVDVEKERRVPRFETVDSSPGTGSPKPTPPGYDRRFDDRGTTEFPGDAYNFQTIRYRIDEDRIFRSGELRYFDHPRFGVLARVTRVEVPATEDFDDLLPATSDRSTP